MHPYLNTAIKAAREGARLILNALERPDLIKIQQKSPNDYVTSVDKEVEAVLINIIQEAYPTHGILSEEAGQIPGKEDITWILDPIDGTINFMHGFPQFAIAMAVKVGDRIEHGLIYDPLKEDLFTATRGGGAQLNNKRIRVKDPKSLSTAMLGVGIPFMQPQAQQEEFHRIFQAMLPKVADMRSPGATTLDLAYVAAGRFHGFFSRGFKIWDIAAGALMVREAGGFVGDYAGGDNLIETDTIVAAGPKIYGEMLKIISSTSDLAP